MLKIEQIAIAPRRGMTDRARELLAALGLDEWIEDDATAQGSVQRRDGSMQPAQNRARLSFNYQATPPSHRGLEFEVLEYLDDTPNWIDGTGHEESVVSHIGVHAETQEEEDNWHHQMRRFRVPVVQQVTTTNHTNPGVPRDRAYRYTIFHTRPILGFDIKIIRRVKREG